MDYVKTLLDQYESDNCDFSVCREMISEIGGPSEIINGKFKQPTTPIHEAVEYGYYDFAAELAAYEGANLDLQTPDIIPLVWELQFLHSEGRKERFRESEGRLRVLRALIRAGANPNPLCGENLLPYISFKIDDGEEDYPSMQHLWEMEHIIEAHAYGETERFFKKLEESAITSIAVSDHGFWLMDDNLCETDHAIFVFDDGEKMLLSSYQKDDDEWDFYARAISDEMFARQAYSRTILANEGNIRLLSLYAHPEDPTSHTLDLYIDDAILRFHADEPNIMIGVCNLNDFVPGRRQMLFSERT